MQIIVGPRMSETIQNPLIGAGCLKGRKHKNDTVKKVLCSWSCFARSLFWKRGNQPKPDVFHNTKNRSPEWVLQNNYSHTPQSDCQSDVSRRTHWGEGALVQLHCETEAKTCCVPGNVTHCQWKAQTSSGEDTGALRTTFLLQMLSPQVTTKAIAESPSVLA